MPLPRLPARLPLSSTRTPLTHLKPQTNPHTHTTAPRTFFSTTTTRTHQTSNDADKKSNLLDKDAMNTSSNEYSKSGGDAEVAHTNAAFDSSTTTPEETKRGVDEENGGDPRHSVDVSPGNPDVSSTGHTNDARTEGSPEQQSGERRVSGGASPVKGKGRGT